MILMVWHASPIWFAVPAAFLLIALVGSRR